MKIKPHQRYIVRYVGGSMDGKTEIADCCGVARVVRARTKRGLLREETYKYTDAVTILTCKYAPKKRKTR